jgi:hypothetical protein
VLLHLAVVLLLLVHPEQGAEQTDDDGAEDASDYTAHDCGVVALFRAGWCGGGGEGCTGEYGGGSDLCWFCGCGRRYGDGGLLEGADMGCGDFGCGGVVAAAVAVGACAAAVRSVVALLDVPCWDWM